MLPALDTARLLIRERTLDDLESCLEMDRDPVAHRQFVQFRIVRQYPPGLGHWSIRELTDPERFIGWVLLIPGHGSGPDVEIGWRLVRSAWGRGIAIEAARALMKHAFETVRLPRVIADIAAESQAPLHVAQKLGMQWVGYDTSDGMRYERYRLVRDDLRGLGKRL